MTTFSTTARHATVAKKLHETDLTLSKPGNLAKLVDIVIPVYNEAKALPECIATLDAYLDANFEYRYRITIVDNGSEDDTWQIAQALAMAYPAVRAQHLTAKGRGRALKYAWRQSDADILAYMDVDLSTDLSALSALVRPLASGSTDVAVGTRLHQNSKVTRGLKREFISRSYNRILRWGLGFKTSDAQCGFKAMTAAAARQLLPEIVDDSWFFDTELLAKAARRGLHIQEVPVIWHEDTDSRVNIIKTARDDLRGVARLRQEFSGRSRWERWTIFGIMAATLLLYGYGALQNGYGNSFYAAAVQAGTNSWKAFFFGSLDASNYITVDKPPVSLWFMEISTRIFGFHSWSMMLPEVLAGVGTVYLVYTSVRRWFSVQSALLAAGIMAVTPVAVLMFGFNNPDAILTFLLTLSVYAVIRALENNHPIRWLSLAAVATGFAFNTKMLQGLIVLPVLALVYFIAAKPKFWKRVAHLTAITAVLAVATLWWPVVVSLTPASSRPYIGSSTDNNIWNLITGYNGVGRLLGSGQGQGGPGGASGANRTGDGGALPTFGDGAQQSTNSTTSNTTFSPPNGTAPTGGFAGRAGGSGPGGSGFGGNTGIFRIFNSDFGPNIAWFIPAGLIATAAAFWQRRRAKRTDSRRAAFLLWGGYVLLHIVVFSMVSGVIHPYYPVVMAPAVAALVGMGTPLLVSAYRRRSSGAWLLPITVATTSIVACIMLGYQSDWLPWLRWVILGVGLISTLGLLLNLIESLQKAVKPLLIAAAVACLMAPTAYALKTATVAHTGSIPSAGPSGTGMQGSNNESATAEAAFVNYLLANQGSAKWIVAVSSANQSAPIQISSGQPVMALGGFNGSDDAITVEQLEQLVASGQLKYYAVSLGGNSTVTSWLTEHGTKVNYGGSDYTLYELHV